MSSSRAGLLAAALLLTVAGCSGDTGGGVASSPGSTTSQASGEPSTSAAPEPVAQRRPDDAEYVFHGARVLLPKGWLYEDYGGGGIACIDAVNLEACSVSLIDPPAVEREGGEIDGPDPDSDFGWYLGTDVPGCSDIDPADYPRDSTGDPPLVESRVIERGFRPLGAKTAVFRAYALTCEGEPQGTARLWFLPDSELAVVALDTYGTTPVEEVDRVVALLDAEDYRA
ncbi:MAG: hypothetical protein M4D85_07475 [Actinomycetota bacterium]|nr:hypothetical protein [Actinomycetota bacterium]